MTAAITLAVAAKYKSIDLKAGKYPECNVIVAGLEVAKMNVEETATLLNSLAALELDLVAFDGSLLPNAENVLGPLAGLASFDEFDSLKYKYLSYSQARRVWARRLAVALFSDKHVWPWDLATATKQSVQTLLSWRPRPDPYQIDPIPSKIGAWQTEQVGAKEPSPPWLSSSQAIWYIDPSEEIADGLGPYAPSTPFPVVAEVAPFEFSDLVDGDGDSVGYHFGWMWDPNPYRGLVAAAVAFSWSALTSSWKAAFVDVVNDQDGKSKLAEAWQAEAGLSTQWKNLVSSLKATTSSSRLYGISTVTEFLRAHLKFRHMRPLKAPLHYMTHSQSLADPYLVPSLEGLINHPSGPSQCLSALAGSLLRTMNIPVRVGNSCLGTLDGISEAEAVTGQVEGLKSIGMANTFWPSLAFQSPNGNVDGIRVASSVFCRDCYAENPQKPVNPATAGTYTNQVGESIERVLALPRSWIWCSHPTGEASFPGLGLYGVSSLAFDGGQFFAARPLLSWLPVDEFEQLHSVTRQVLDAYSQPVKMPLYFLARFYVAPNTKTAGNDATPVTYRVGLNKLCVDVSVASKGGGLNLALDASSRVGYFAYRESIVGLCAYLYLGDDDKLLSWVLSVSKQWATELVKSVGMLENQPVVLPSETIVWQKGETFKTYVARALSCMVDVFGIGDGPTKAAERDASILSHSGGVLSNTPPFAGVLPKYFRFHNPLEINTIFAKWSYRTNKFGSAAAPVDSFWQLDLVYAEGLVSDPAVQVALVMVARLLVDSDFSLGQLKAVRATRLEELKSIASRMH